LTVFGLGVAAIVVAFLALRLGLDVRKGVTLRIESGTTTNATCLVFWTTAEQKEYSLDRALALQLVPGEAAEAFLPMTARLTGLEFYAPGVRLGRVMALGKEKMLWSATVRDLPKRIDLPAGRFPVWRWKGWK